MNALSISWAPLLPWFAIGALGAFAAIVVIFALLRRASGAWWRALAAGLLLLALANPALVEEERDPLKDIVQVVVDQSPSQQIGEREAQTEVALAQLLEDLEQLPETEIRVLRTAEGGDRLDGDGTRLLQEIQTSLAKIPRQRLGGIIVLSDGQVHDLPEDPAAALAVDVPVHLLLTGREGERDRRLTVVQAPSFAIVGKTVALSFLVEDLGSASGGGLVEIVLRQDGEERERIRVPIGVQQEIELQLDRRGPSVIELEAAAAAEELSLANNRAAIEVNGVRDRLRVLLVSGEPHAGERAWRNILKSDPSVDLVHFTILRPPEKQDGTPIRELSLIAFPTRELFEVKLDEFDLIIFDRYRRRGVLPTIYLENIAQYVEQGGALLEAVGPTFATPLSLYRTPLGRVLPGAPSGTIFEEGFVPAVTELGLRHPVTASLPDAAPEPGAKAAWGRWFRHIDSDRLRGDVVMSGIEERPLLILDRVGEGRVAQFMSDHMWLWSRGFEGGGPQAELLRRISHWLMKEPDLEEEDLRAAFADGRLEIRRRSLFEETPDVEVTWPSGTTRKVPLEAASSGQATAAIAADEFGLYRVNDGEKSALVAVGPLNPLEYKDLRSTADLLGPLIEATGGDVIRLAQQDPPQVRKVRQGRDRHGRGWIGVTGGNAYVVTGARQLPVLPGVLVLAAVLAAVVTAWYREGR